jgi:hypothetical protein
VAFVVIHELIDNDKPADWLGWRERNNPTSSLWRQSTNGVPLTGQTVVLTHVWFNRPRTTSVRWTKTGASPLQAAQEGSGTSGTGHALFLVNPFQQVTGTMACIAIRHMSRERDR